jgi:predicted DNA-binding transcriptional regulator AlpA
VPDLVDLPDERLLRRREAATLIGTSVRTMVRWDKSQKGPTPIRLSKRMTRYAVGGIREWLRVIGKRAVNDEGMF